MHTISILITGAAIIGLTPSVLGLIMSGARTYRALANDGLLPSYFGKIDEKTKVPVRAAWVNSILTLFACTFLDLDTLATIASIVVLLIYSTMCTAFLQMRL